VNQGALIRLAQPDLRGKTSPIQRFGAKLALNH
jgi:hypothetical protein